MTEALKIDEFSILATATRLDDRTRVLKQGETFAVFDRFGDIAPVGQGELGLYHEGTRFLSELTLLLGEDRPLLLSSAVRLDNTLFSGDLTNPDVLLDGDTRIPRGTLHVRRRRFLWQAVWYEELEVANHGLVPLSFSLRLRFDSDFADVFEVRGTKRARRGRREPTSVGARGAILGYEGLDGVRRRTRLEFSRDPNDLGPTAARFDFTIPPRQREPIWLTVSCEIDGAERPRLSYAEGRRRRVESYELARREDCGIASSNEQFDRWLGRSLSDLEMMLTEEAQGPYPFAGVPWYSTEFGRDGIITALEALWVDPRIARGVLAYLAATQARREAPEEDAEPGKILHEARKGEMATLKEVPFARYYGSVDSTPLFVVLAAAYFDRTADLAFLREIWPNVERALEWIDTHGDRDGDGFVEYLRKSVHGLGNQGWKDSYDAVFHADGTLATGPIALCEVQGYVYAARRGAATLARALGRMDLADRLLEQAERLRLAFEERFWIEDLQTYALALDGDKRPCAVRTSNAGQVLLSGIASTEHAVAVADTLLSESSFSGFGIRTVDSAESRYNPMSYHDGSVWPHDNALIAAGFARYGLKKPVRKVFDGLFQASQFVEVHRMPELFCGFAASSGEGPTLYPVACSPQSWAAGSVLLLLQACLGLSIRAGERAVSFSYPVLPDCLDEVRIRRLRVGDASLSLLIRRHNDDVSVNVVSREGEVGVVVVK